MGVVRVGAIDWARPLGLPGDAGKLGDEGAPEFAAYASVYREPRHTSIGLLGQHEPRSALPRRALGLRVASVMAHAAGCRGWGLPWPLLLAASRGSGRACEREEYPENPGSCERQPRSSGRGWEMIVKPSAQPTLVRTQHLPRKSPGQTRYQR